MKRALHPSVLTVTGPSVRRTAAFAAEASSHVLGEEAAVKLAEMQANAVLVLRGRCDECGNDPNPAEKLTFAAIVRLVEKNRVVEDEIFIVPAETLTFIKDVTVKFDGEDNVSVLFISLSLFKFIQIFYHFFTLIEINVLVEIKFKSIKMYSFEQIHLIRILF